MNSDIQYYCYPRTQSPPEFADHLVSAFRSNESAINTLELEDGLTSDEVLEEVRPELKTTGFDVEEGKKMDEKIHRPVLFGQNGEPELRYEVDAYHPEWRCGLEVEAGRAWKGNAIYRDLIQASMMVEVDTLAMAVPNAYKHANGTNPAFEKTNAVVDTLYAADRIVLPFDLVLIGY